MNYTDDRNLKVVVSPILAAKLCDMGYPIVKIKPKKNIGNSQSNEFGGETVFLFEATNDFLKDFNFLIYNLKKGN